MQFSPLDDHADFAQLRRLRAAINGASLLVTEVDAQGVITYANPAAQYYFGYAPEECIGKPVLELTHPDDRDHLQQQVMEWLQRGLQTATSTHRITHRDGRTFYFLWSVTIHYNEQGLPVGFTSIGHDISPQERLQKELFESREMLYTVIDNLPLGVFWKDTASRFMGCNRRALQDAGLAHFADIIGKTDFELPWRDKAERYQYSDRVVMETGPKLNVEETFTRSDGTTIRIRVAKLPMRRNGEVIGVLGLYEDITELRQQEEGLRTFRLLVENAPDGIGIVDPDLQITYANPAFAAMLGHETIENLAWPDLVYPADRDLLASVVQQASQAGSARATIRYLHRDGALITAQIAVPALRDRKETLLGYAIINRDITEQLRFETMLRAGEQRQRALIKALPDMFFLLSRDGVFLDFKADSKDDLALPPEVFLNRRIDEVMPPELVALTKRHIEALLHTGRLQQFEYQLPIGHELRDYEARMTLSDDNVLVIVRDITEQRRAERERQMLAVQEQVIQAQQAVLRELSTPLLPIADGVVVMPLIGAIDTARAQQILETLLAGVSRYRAKFAIIDITGVKVVDTQVAGALIRAAQAVGLLGAQVVLTGISPEIAQTLVHIGVTMQGLVTRATLQEGVAYALHRRLVPQQVNGKGR
ncbi:PAS domain S-box protein [Chloroflexus sp.]|uniref:PAS domain S-box protein n=1 Tax=Chloroflexus sp. TaxID=1904827 RepID=UPI00298ED733|nr:PAS domain S-box protein [Chloroflexus sp.]MDW8404257.1 PAS domain S-box protein [Chloroflexus sp.]